MRGARGNSRTGSAYALADAHLARIDRGGAIRLTLGDWHLAKMRIALDAARFDEASAEYKAAARWGLHADLWYSRKLLSEFGRHT